MRVALQDAYGLYENSYARTHPVQEPAPDAPWALPLTDASGMFHFVVFDLDAKDGNPGADTRRLTRWLDELAIAHVVCASGPTGGRHVWVALNEGADPDLVSRLARRARLVLRSLDIRPLSNPVAGAVRPPLAPHRASGHSQPLGILDPLLRPSTTPRQLELLDQWLEEEGVELPAPSRTSHPRGVVVDESGHPHLSGDRRELSQRIRAMLDAAPAEDASATMAQIFLAAANARWRRDDVVKLALHSPALEHARTRRIGQSRIPRTGSGFHHAVDSAWRMAVAYAAAHPTERIGDDPTFPAREKAVVAALTRAQARANALPGLWGADRRNRAYRRIRGSAAHRAVFDALCLFMAQAVQLEIEADVRRLALETGWGRSTVHTALRVLCELGWIVRAEESDGEHGARYALAEFFSTESDVRDWTQGRKPADRRGLIRELSLRLESLNLDVFAAPRSLGRSAGLIYQRMREGGKWVVGELSSSTGIEPTAVRKFLKRLSGHRLVRLVDGRWSTDPDTDPEGVAMRLGVRGYLSDRRLRYEVERETWASWNHELRRLRQNHVARRRSRPHPSALQLPGQPQHERARYPRGPDGRPDHVLARRLALARRYTRELVDTLEMELFSTPAPPRSSLVGSS